MKSQPNRNYTSNDVVMTPVDLAQRIYNYYNPTGIILEPCRGSGAFYNLFPDGSPYCELSEGKDFFDFHEKVDWIITNPPWSKVRSFLAHGMSIADNVVYLFTINHIWTKARVKLIYDSGFYIHEIILIDMPKTFPQSGFQLGVVYLRRGEVNPTIITDWRTA